ncbi:uncharacterized protein LOC100276296 [Zea mays]|uniref:Uncharacterized protein n=1 Tax=Zea mays TaxID=4577 RepID=B6T8A1_MAIZE|nr:uncharacterized protein LOC100276296 [Zea mays]ACG33334.1 hypothetical protein [Zea mays]|eukprot:NP_001143592.1 uncharacterized protein LOC100276296 [Zea mays]
MPRQRLDRAKWRRSCLSVVAGSCTVSLSPVAVRARACRRRSRTLLLAGDYARSTAPRRTRVVLHSGAAAAGHNDGFKHANGIRSTVAPIMPTVKLHGPKLLLPRRGKKVRVVLFAGRPYEPVF